jgi:hypothetical protein
MSLYDTKVETLADALRVIQTIEGREGRVPADAALAEALTAGETALLIKALRLQSEVAAKNVEIASRVLARSEECEAEISRLLAEFQESWAEVQARMTELKQIRVDAKTQADELNQLLWKIDGEEPV